MRKRTWGIILIVLAGMALFGGIVNGSISNEKNLITLISYFGCIGALLFFGVRFLKG